MPTYRSPWAASLIIHIGVAIALFTMVSIPLSTTPVPKHTVIYIHSIPTHAPGGGGGARATLPASQGRLPKQSPHPFTPPMILAAPHEPVLPMAPALLTASDPSNLPQWGDPLSNSLVSSNGPGDGGGIGSGHNLGVGPGAGPGAGAGPRPGIGGSGTLIGVSAPELLYKVL